MQAYSARTFHSATAIATPCSGDSTTTFDRVGGDGLRAVFEPVEGRFHHVSDHRADRFVAPVLFGMGGAVATDQRGLAAIAVRCATRAGNACRRLVQAVRPKRVFDIVVSAALILVTAPALLLVALMIRMDSRGPILFHQTRIGEKGRPFTMYKFRSMHSDAEARLKEVRALSDRTGICFKSRHDPRVTRIGRVLRRYSIDESPQILNVLLGNMSLVGPRPALPREVAAYPAHALERLEVKPGITGLWQVAGRADIGFDKMVDMDVAYVRSNSVALDLLLLAMTARAVVSGRGAY
jgi:lipopolysaccharide/colanic/teichoic acid biosynthesis glycosyltransferase